ncbi:serine/threonine protein kinase [Actinopolymorpha rutila]|uniref:Serine/threonine protein kinase n=1 Tax=Actinopolymorpha rutila TaxID=446787 RepID=A0A852ZHS9_9ACTN|nr:serine/threonine protein kinase [Actinopolymorpha rutila]
MSKYAPRGFSGKLVTIYPVDDAACEKILVELGELLEGEPSPYILTDLRWGRGPLYVRYGAFANRRYFSADGQLVSAIEDDTGALVPDSRDPIFRVPHWVRLPEFLAPHLAARNAVTLADVPYTIERVVHFSNGGGIYVGRCTRTGEQVVLKEGRPHSGLDGRGHDATTRIEHEYDMLRRLAGIPGIPKVRDLFWLGEHRFLAMEYVDAVPLNKAIVQQYPLIDPAAGPREYKDYTDWALDIYHQIETTIDAVHERGVVYGDLHLFNIMVRDDQTIALLDYEVSASVDDPTPPGLGNQGFTAPPGTTGFDVDRYALSCLRLALFIPMTSLIWLHRGKAQHFAEAIRTHFPVPEAYVQKALQLIAPEPAPLLAIEPDERHWPELRNALVRAILASATPGRDDRLFPGDIEQFVLGGLGLAYGAAGVLYALSASGAGRFPQYEDWFVRQVRNVPSSTLPGLYDGLHGAAFVLDHLGYEQEALDAVDRCLTGDWESLGPDLASGLAGVGLNLMHFAARTGDPTLRTAALRAAELTVDRIGSDVGEPAPGDEPPISGGGNPPAGLLRGKAGSALLLIRVYDETGDIGYLDQAAVALRQDLLRCVVRDNGVLEVNEGWRTMPYLDSGSVGIGLVLDEYLARRHDSQFAEASSRISRAAQAEFYVLPGLFSGRAGILLYLASQSPSPAADPLVSKQVSGLALPAVPYGGGIAFPGTALLRLSMDLATGTAGVLLALGAALHDRPVTLPLITTAARPATTPRVPAPAGAGL